jgi:soluble lytic murein transglycosylase
MWGSRVRKIILPLIIAFISFMALFYYDVPWNILRPVLHQETIENTAIKYGFDPLFINSVIRAESSFFFRARSNRGATGLMQLMPTTARELAQELNMKDFSDADLETPDINIRLGVYYLSKLWKEFDGNQILVLASYNAGIGKVQGWYKQNPILALEINDIPYEETRGYVSRVERTYKWLKRIQKIKKALQKKGA